MADKPTGPVKPPTLDLTARKAETGQEKSSASAKAAPDSRADAAAKPSTSTAAEKGAPQTGTSESPAKGAPKPAPAQKPSTATPELPILPLAATGLGGAALGLAAAYGLALAGFWPGSGTVDLSPYETRIARSENTLALNAAALAEMDARVGGLETADPAEPPQLPDNLVTLETLEPLQSRIDALGLRLEAVASGAPADESEQLASEMARLGSGLAQIETRLDQSDSGVSAVTDQVQSLDSRLESLETRIADQVSIDAMRAERDRFAQLPAASAALEAAMASGGPFGTELAMVESLVPELAVTNAARSVAARGAKPARIIARDFREMIPALLAARPRDPQAGWLDSLVEQAQSAIALRPLDDEGDAPEALVGRIETALESDDAATARSLILDLPDAMQAVAAPVRSDLDALIAARALIGDIRALAPQAMEGGQ